MVSYESELELVCGVKSGGEGEGAEEGIGMRRRYYLLPTNNTDERGKGERGMRIIRGQVNDTDERGKRGRKGKERERALLYWGWKGRS